MKRLLMGILLLCCFSCLDEVNLTIPQKPGRLVVEGFLNNNEAYLRLSTTAVIGFTDGIIPLEGAQVKIISENGAEVILRPDIAESGVYKIDNKGWTPKIEIPLALYLKLPNGDEYHSEFERMPEAVKVDSLDATFIKTNKKGYQIMVNFKDPAKEGNFYRWEAEGYFPRNSNSESCCSLCNIYLKNTDINIFKDVSINGNAVKGKEVFFSPFYNVGKHYIEVKQYAISRDAYQYWLKYEAQRKRTGSIFDPLPAPLPGNVKNIKNPAIRALGFFEISSVSAKKMIVRGDTLSAYRNFSDELTLTPNGDCMKVFRDAKYVYMPLKGW